MICDMSHCRRYLISLLLCLAVLVSLVAFLVVIKRPQIEPAGTFDPQPTGTLRLPTVPSMLRTPQEQASYLSEHYWENYNFADTTLISKSEITEQAFVDFVNILPHATAESAGKALTTLMSSAAADSAMFAHFAGLAEKYLYDPNSPYRDETLYISVLRYIVAAPEVDAWSKIRPQAQLDLALKNRPGDVAADFVYTLADGRRQRMHALKSEYTILFFNNPDCYDCLRVKEYIAASPLFRRIRNKRGMSERARVTILAIYPDEDVALWRKATYPEGIINGRDAGCVISEKQVYDLKAIPTLYLLDHNKRVLLKDAPIEKIENYLQIR